MMKTNVLLTAILLCFACKIAATKEKPNVVVFLVDDLRTDIGCYGSDIVKSPNIDALAADGIRFSNAYCQQAICGPSRLSILTGKRPETIGVYSIFTRLRTAHPNMVSMPQLFKENGYKTISVGKVYHHANDDTKSWTTHIPKEGKCYLLPQNIAIIDSLKKSGSKGNCVPYEAADVDDNGYKGGRTASDAIKYLKQVKNDPFLMFVGLTKPHLPFNAPKKYWDLYNRDEIDVPQRVEPSDRSDYALTKWFELRNYHGMPKEGYLSDEQTRILRHGYYACVSYTDAQIGRVMKALEDLDLRKNTMVILMSDHGWKLGEYGAWCKHTNFQIDTHVPMIISRETGYKKRKTGKVSDALVENVDLFSTAADFCGLETPKLEGRSLLPLTENPKAKWNEAAYSLYNRGTTMGVTCTDGAFRYTEWRDGNTQEIKDTELYKLNGNLVTSQENMVDNSKYSRDLKRMKALLYKRFPTDRDTFYFLPKKK